MSTVDAFPEAAVDPSVDPDRRYTTRETMALCMCLSIYALLHLRCAPTEAFRSELANRRACDAGPWTSGLAYNIRLLLLRGLDTPAPTCPDCCALIDQALEQRQTTDHHIVLK